MDVYDTNVWIFGMHDTDSRAGELVQQAVYGDREVAVTAYLYHEVIENIGQGLPRKQAEKATNSFATFVNESDSILGPNDNDLNEIEVNAERNNHRVQMISDAIGCQPKDAPIAEIAYVLAKVGRSKSTIYTNDGGNSKKEDGLVDVDFARYRVSGDNAVRSNPTKANPLGWIQTTYVPQPPSIS